MERETGLEPVRSSLGSWQQIWRRSKLETKNSAFPAPRSGPRLFKHYGPAYTFNDGWFFVIQCSTTATNSLVFVTISSVSVSVATKASS